MDKLIYRVLDDAFHVAAISAPHHRYVRRYLSELGHRRVKEHRVIGNVNPCDILCCLGKREKEKAVLNYPSPAFPHLRTLIDKVCYRDVSVFGRSINLLGFSINDDIMSR